MDLELTYILRADGTRKLTIPDDRRALAISFLRESGRKPAAEIASLTDAGHRALLDAVSDVTEAQAAHKPSADDWSILELMAHVVTAKQIVATLSAALGEGHLPPGFGAAVGNEAAQDGITVTRFATLSDARAAADDAHASLIASVRGLGSAANTDMTFKHFVFGDLNCREWAAFQRLHDDDHAPQVGKIRASQGFPEA